MKVLTKNKINMQVSVAEWLARLGFKRLLNVYGGFVYR